MSLLATLSESMTWTQKQIVGFVVIGLIGLTLAYQAFKRKQYVAVLAAAAVLVWLARGIGAPQ
jgi:putative Mn2+ efflux pump MntP